MVMSWEGWRSAMGVFEPFDVVRTHYLYVGAGPLWGRHNGRVCNCEALYQRGTCWSRWFIVQSYPGVYTMLFRPLLPRTLHGAD